VLLIIDHQDLFLLRIHAVTPRYEISPGQSAVASQAGGLYRCSLK
jgi:hypothetical protein